MKMKLPDLGERVITIRSDQKEAKRYYENNLKTKRGVFMVTTVEPCGVHVLKNPNPLKDVEASTMLVVVVLV